MVVPVPVLLTEPGVLVRVHVPEDGRPLSAALPVASAQVGWVNAPTTGAVGMEFTVSVTAFEVAFDPPEQFEILQRYW